MTFLVVVIFVAAVFCVAALVSLVVLFRRSEAIGRQSEALVPPVGNFLDLGGDRIHYVDEGSGPPIVFIHGLGGNLHHFRYPLFSRLRDDFRLVALDRPGSGYSTRSDDRRAILAEQARTVAEFIERMGLDRSPLLVGHSLGGAIALRVALDHPGKVAGLALISPLTRNQTEGPREFGLLAIRNRMLRRIVSRTIAMPLSVRTAPQVLDFVFGPQKPPADFAVEGGALTGLRPSHFFATSTDYAALEGAMKEQEDHYHEIAVPVGVLYGSEDRVLDHKLHGVELPSRLKTAHVEILRGIGHMPQYEQGERVAAFLGEMADRAFNRA